MALGRTWRWTLVTIAVVLALAGCGGGDVDATGVQPASVETRQTIGPEGGSIKATTAPLTGAGAAFPPGALATPTEIVLRPSTLVIPGAVGPVVEFGPAGARFEQPVRVTLPFERARVPAGVADGALIAALVLAGGKLQALPELRVDSAARTVSGLTTHFSAFVAVAPDAPGLPQPPVADAGADQTVTLGATVTLDGSASSDVNGDALGYLWTLVERPANSAAQLSSTSVVRPSFVADRPGRYVAELVVRDASASSAADRVIIQTANSAPVANAGNDQTVALGALVTLDASASSDVDGDTLTFAWSILARPAGSAAAISDPGAVMPQFSADRAGEYRLGLVVSDGRVASPADEVRVSTSNTAPIANAGADASARVNDTVTLDASGSADPDGNTISYRWSFLSRPAGSAAALSNASAIRPTFTLDVAGDYVAQLVVSDGTLTATDSVMVTTLNSAPVARAGADQDVDAGATVALDGGTSSDVDGDPLSYQWSLTTRPEGSTAVLSSTTQAQTSFVADRPGQYVAQLVVNDGAVASAPDTVNIGAVQPNLRPVANAGPDQAASTDTAVLLDGRNSTDANADALTFRWSLISRPAGSVATLDDAASPTPSFTPELAGDYVAQLIVNDGALDSEPDTALISVTVPGGNRAPTARAGSDASVPANDGLRLDGSASSDPDFDPLSYAWAIQTAPNGSAAPLLGPDTAAPLFTPDREGSYVLSLIVNDGTVASSPDTVTITASAAPAQTFENCGDGVDNDANGATDFADAACNVPCDFDGDGSLGAQCKGPDPDDSSNKTFPGAPEFCGDDLDNNGDGIVDEGCYAGTIVLLPADLVMVAGDRRTLHVVPDDGGSTTASWVYRVEGVEGGTPGTGLLTALPAVPDRAQFTAPFVTQTTEVQVSATDSLNPARVAQAVIRVVPLGQLEIRPSAITLGVGGRADFSVGQMVEGVGFVPVAGARWRVNGVVGGTLPVGRVDSAGRYRAPPVLPDTLPRSIGVGVALSDSGAEVARASVRVAELIANPRQFLVQDSGEAGPVTASLKFSDNTTAAVPDSSLVYTQGDIKIAFVTGGVMFINTVRVGKTAVRVTHKNLFAFDDVLVDSRSRVNLRNEVSFIGADRARVNYFGATTGATLIEYSRPGATFRLVPTIRFARGQDGGNSVAVGGGNLVSYLPQSTDIVSYDAADGLPDLSAKVAAIENRSGIVTIGKKSGAAILRTRYDDGLVSAEVNLEIRFTRPELSGAIQVNQDTINPITGPVSGFVYDRYNLTLNLDNPLDDSTFVDRTELRVRRADGGSFRAMSGRDLFTGDAVRRAFLAQLIEPTSELSLPVARSADRGGSDPPYAAAFGLLLDSVEPQEFIIDRPEDPELAPLRVTLTPRRPTLAVSDCNDLANARVLAGFGARAEPLDGSLPALRFQRAASSDFGRERIVWRITDPANQTLEFPYRESKTFSNQTDPGDEGYSSGLFSQPGRWTVQMRMPGLAAHETEPLGVDVLDASDSVAAAPRNASTVPAGNQLGTVELVGEPPETWVPGVPFTLNFQTYNALGAERRIASGRPPEGAENPFFAGSATVFVQNRTDVSPEIVTGEPDAGGTITVRVTPGLDADPRIPIVLAFSGGLSGVAPDGVANQAIGVASYVNPGDRAYLAGCFAIPGRGLVIEPRELPVASQAVRDATAAGLLDGTGFDDKLRFTLSGGPSFAQELAQGIASLDLGPGITVESTTVEGGRLLVVAKAALATETGGRRFTLRTNGGPGGTSEWRGVVSMVRAEVGATTSHSDKNLPMNGMHHNSHPPASQVFVAGINGLSGFVDSLLVTATLVPSLKAGDVFRGVEVDQPIVAFQRKVDPATGEPRMKDLTQDVLTTVNGGNFLVFGNNVDRYRLDPRDQRLCAVQPCPRDPDLLPDFVSPEKDAELLLTSVRGNLLDLTRFTAFNLVTEMTQPLSTDPLDFEALRGTLSDDELRLRYSGVTPRIDNGQIVDLETETGPAVAARDGARALRVYVDNESGAAGLPARRNILNYQFFGGILDQHFLERSLGYDVDRLSTTSRMHGFNGERKRTPLNVTGVTRMPFGIELDGVLYDPTLFGIDDDPNSPPLVAPFIVRELAGVAEGGGTQLTVDGLLRDQGGSSGGYVDLDTHRGAAHTVLAKTPGFEIPGVPAGYLVERRPDQLTKNCNSGTGVANDYDDVVITRPDGPGTAIGGPVTGLAQLAACPIQNDPRRVLSMGSDREQRTPVATAMRAQTMRRVTTDPPGLSGIKFRGALMVRERPFARPEDAIALMVNTRSTGNEAISKAVFDQFIDNGVTLVAGLFLNAVSAGGYLAACGPDGLADIGGDVLFGLATLGASAAQNEVFGGNTEVLSTVNGVAQDGVELGNTGVQLSIKDIMPIYEASLEDADELAGLPEDLAKKLVRVQELKKLGICALANAPFEKLKAELQKQVSVEALGGNGAAGAFARKTVTVMIPKSAIRSTGVAAIGFEAQRRVEIFPKEPFAVALADQPAPNPFKLPSTAISDFEFLAGLHRTLANPATITQTREAVINLVNKARVASLIRAPETAHAEQYEEHKLRYMTMPLIEGTIVPLKRLGLSNTGDTVADFELETGATEIPVIASTLTAASRTNENAGARAAVTSEGYDLILLGAQIPLRP